LILFFNLLKLEVDISTSKAIIMVDFLFIVLKNDAQIIDLDIIFYI